MLTDAVASALLEADEISAVDLGAGAGSNVRYLAERIAGRQRWLAVDRSAELLAEVPRRMATWASARGYQARFEGGQCHVRAPHFQCAVETGQRDLCALDAGLFAGRHLVTASALLDLVPESWLGALAARCRAAGAVALFTITYNGRSSCTPVEDEDEMVRDLFNQHQKTNIGFGAPAAGPDAANLAEQCFTEAGYHVRRANSDWKLGPADGAMQRFLIEGWAEAATEIAPGRTSAIASWRERRLAHVAAGRSHILVGHDDLAAL